MRDVLTATSADGTEVRAVVEGDGPPILLVHGGADDGSSWHRVAHRLSPNWRVVRLHRRQYRLDLADGLPCSILQEADDVVALAQTLGEPVVLGGHSSGAVVALEALVTAPSLFAGAVLYEPPVHLRPHEWAEPIRRAKAAVAAGRPGQAMRVFSRDVAGLPDRLARLNGIAATLLPRLRAFAPRQIDDASAIDDLGVRVDSYARIEVPVVLLSGERSPAHFAERVDALVGAIPAATKVVLPGQSHNALVMAPDAVVNAITDLATQNRQT